MSYSCSDHQEITKKHDSHAKTVTWDVNDGIRFKGLLREAEASFCNKKKGELE